MTSYRLMLMRSALGRIGRAVAYYWVATRAQLRAARSSYRIQMVGYRIRVGASAVGRLLRRLPRTVGAAFGLIAWFLGQLPAYVSRVIEERREDRAELRAERRLVSAQIRAQRAERRERRRAVVAERRARRRAQQAEIKAAATKRPHALPVPAWISRTERPELPALTRRVPRRALVAAVITLAAAVPAYSVVTGGVGSEDRSRAASGVAAEPSATVVPATIPGTAVPGTATPVLPATPGVPAAGPAAPGPVVSGDTGVFVRTLPILPTATPTMPAPRVRVSTPDGPQFVEVPVIGSLTTPLTAEQQRQVKRQARWQAKVVRGEQPYVGKGK